VLGSIGEVEHREVCRPDWWSALGGEGLIGSHSDHNRGWRRKGETDDKYDDYWVITPLIEEEHQGEKLESGTIYFGS